MSQHVEQWVIEATRQLAAASNGAGTREERLARRLRAMLKPNPRGALLTGGRLYPDEDFVTNLAGFLAKRFENGTLSETLITQDMLMANRSTLWRNLRDRLGINYRELERIVRNE